jgi:hypothetical protein
MILEERVMSRSRVGRKVKDVIGLMFPNQSLDLLGLRHVADDPATVPIRSGNADDLDSLPAKQVAQVKTVLSADSKNKGVHIAIFERPKQRGSRKCSIMLDCPW